MGVNQNLETLECKIKMIPKFKGVKLYFSLKIIKLMQYR